MPRPKSRPVHKAMSVYRYKHEKMRVSATVAIAAIGLTHNKAADEDEALGGGDVEPIAAGNGVQPGVAAEVIDDHGEDAKAAQEVQAQVAATGDVSRAVVAPGADTFEQ